MKKLVIVAGVMAAVAANAQTNQVLSRNAVGYEKVVVSTGQLVLARNDFNNLGGSPYTVTNLIGNSLPQGSSVLLWDSVGQSYIAENKTRSGWSPGTNVIRRGAGFFMSVPSAAASNSYDVFFMGEVPDATTAPSTTVNGVTALAMYGFPYPVAQFWTNMNIAKNAVSGDSLLLWDVSSQQYVAHNRTRSGWGTGTNVVINPAQGFWFKTAATQTWTEVKPYTWP